ncbi:MAG: LytTR family transcriptional regulator [Erysipelotrichaceae bacterium]|jgi:DNA-binding LytR/AlgR family response regulator|nr:LytTR family transcriptional regulator [Erysipelotrichaceae bacterium]
MKIRVEIDETLQEDELIIHCRKVDESIAAIQNFVSSQKKAPTFEFRKGDQEYFLDLNDILFFETGDDIVFGHTREDAYQIKMRLYELEDLLPKNFVRISKSTIANILHIRSLQHRFNSASLIQFRDTHKEVYVSRMYYKILKEKMQERRYYEK